MNYIVNLKEYISEIESGRRPQGGSISKGIPSLGGEHVNEFGGFYLSPGKLKYVSEEFFNEMKKGVIKLHDILLVKDGATTGKVSYVDEDFPLKKACINEHLFILRPKTDDLIPKYLFYYLYSPLGQKEVLKDFRGATIGGISKNFIDMPIYIPNEVTQKKIIKVLDKAKNLIENRKQQIEACDELIKSQFVEMFGDPVANPMGWPIEKLGNLCVQINCGNTPKGGSEVYVDKGITFFRSQNVWKDRLEMDDIAFIDEATHASMSRSSLKHGDILMTKTGRINTENSSLGRAALYMGEDDAANVNGHVYFIRLKPGVNNKFILRILVSSEYRDLIRSVCVGGIDKRQLNKEHIEEFPIICPPNNMINKYVNFVEQVDRLKSSLQKSLTELETNFKALMQKAFNGELFE